MRSARRIGLLVVLFSSIQLLAASDLIRINESEMKATVVDKEISVGMSVWNDSEAEITGTMSFDLLDSNDVAVSTSKFTEELKPGRNVAILKVSAANMPGCLSYVVAEDSSDPNALWVTEVWDSEASHTASLSLPAVKNSIPQSKA